MKWVLRVLLTLASAGFRLKRPPRIDLERQLFVGVSYARRAQDSPRPLMIYLVELDLNTPGLDFLVTPPDNDSSMDTWARTTGRFLEEHGLQIAVNGAFFDPFRAGPPWSYEPMGGEPVDVRGLAISDGLVYSQDYPEYPVLCLLPGRGEISEAGCPAGTRQALAGNVILVREGRSLFADDQTCGTSIHPRTAVGLDATGETLWLLVVDGRQPNYSEGVSISELAEIAVEAGIATALNLDGGGSSTLVVAGEHGAQTLNSPIHTRIPTRQRPIGNHLGIFAQPVGADIDMHDRDVQ